MRQENLTKPDTGDPRDVFRNNPMHAPKTNPHKDPGMMANDDIADATQDAAAEG